MKTYLLWRRENGRWLLLAKFVDVREAALFFNSYAHDGYHVTLNTGRLA